jgi:hypothetical protein
MSFHFRPTENFTRIVELTPALRREIEATVEHLIAMLDRFDGDENVEDGGDNEPSLGWTEREAGSPRYHPCDDREEEDEHGGDILDERHDGGEDDEDDNREERFL